MFIHSNLANLEYVYIVCIRATFNTCHYISSIPKLLPNAPVFQTSKHCFDVEITMHQMLYEDDDVS